MYFRTGGWWCLDVVAVVQWVLRASVVAYWTSRLSISAYSIIFLYIYYVKTMFVSSRTFQIAYCSSEDENFHTIFIKLLFSSICSLGEVDAMNTIFPFLLFSLIFWTSFFSLLFWDIMGTFSPNFQNFKKCLVGSSFIFYHLYTIVIW